MPPAFVLSQDQTLRFALAPAPPKGNAGAQAQGTHITQLGFQDARRACPPGRRRLRIPFPHSRCQRTSQPYQGRGAPYKLTPKSASTGFSPGTDRRSACTSREAEAAARSGTAQGSGCREGRLGGREAIYSAAPRPCPGARSQKMRRCTMRRRRHGAAPRHRPARPIVETAPARALTEAPHPEPLPPASTFAAPARVPPNRSAPPLARSGRA